MVRTTRLFPPVFKVSTNMSASTFAPVADPSLLRTGSTARPDAGIRTQLLACPAVRAAIVLERTDRPGGRNLIAYLCMHDGYATEAAAALRELTRVMPAHMLPSTLVTLDAMPLDDAGWIDIAALPAPDSASLGLRQYEAPAGPVEKAIATIWQELLGLERIGRNAHFFELGGHSSLGIQLVSRLREETQVNIPLRELFLAPTLHRFAAEVATRITSIDFTAGTQRGCPSSASTV